MNRRVYLAFVTLVLLIGAVLRAADIGRMADMVHYDEAYYAVDALSLLEQPRLNPFFLDNFGRESLWMYALTPALAVFGAGAFALRVTAFFAGMLTLATTGLLARVLSGRRVAIWTVAALGVLFWHVLMSHLAFRALLYPLIGALAWASLIIAWRTNRTSHWLIAGAAFGALGYTYFAARGWVALGLLVGMSGALRSGERWRGLLIAGMMGVGIGAPLIFYLLATPASAERLDQVAISDGQMLIDNLSVWLNVWVGHGADDPVFNLPGRPLLDAPLAVLAAVGIAAAVFVPVQRRRGMIYHAPTTARHASSLQGRLLALALIFALLAVSIAPAVLTTEPLKWLRGIGVVVPLALILGAGAAALATMFGGMIYHAPTKESVREKTRWAWIIPAGLIAWAAANSARDFQTWVTSPDLYVPMERALYNGIEQVAEQLPGGSPVYFAPFTPDHPVLHFRAWRLGEHPVGAFKSVDCLPLTDGGADYFVIDAFEPDLPAHLAAWGEMRLLGSTREVPLPSSLIHLTPDALPADGWVYFGGVIAARALDLPESAGRGEVIRVDVALRRIGQVERAHTAFLHTYPAEETRLLTQVDDPLCLSYPPNAWRSAETIIETYSLTLPDQAGTYRVALGIYDSETQERLPLGDGSDVATIGTIQVGDK